ENILTIELVNGMLCYSSGGAYGAPYIHLGPIGVNNNVEKHNGMEHYKDYFIIFGKRFATKAKEIFS
nr:flavodoxin family protein [Lachnospiraceae bacterium]